jgi:hypothetical protein
VGVVLIAARGAGIRLDRTPAYDLSGDNAALMEAVFIANGCARLRVDEAGPGDVAVLAPAAGRLHLGVLTPRGMVHAHAGLGQVVEGPVDPDWIWVGAWRLLGAI